jgi:hypothetical protein
MANNVGMGIENVILLLVILGSVIFFAKDFKLGAVMLFLSNACLFIAFYAGGLDYSKVLATMMISFVILSLSLYGCIKTEQSRSIS